MTTFPGSPPVQKGALVGLDPFNPLASVIVFQVVFALVMSLAALGGKIVLTEEIGLPGTIWATILAYMVFSAIPLAIYVPRLLRRLESGRRYALAEGRWSG